MVQLEFSGQLRRAHGSYGVLCVVVVGASVVGLSVIVSWVVGATVVGATVGFT